MKKFGYSPKELQVLRKLSSPTKIQDFLNTLPANFEKKGETCRSPRQVLKHKTAHCMEGALLAAAALELHNYLPLIIDLRSAKPEDDDHIITVYRQFGCWGAISKTNHAVLRYREPIYKTIHELVISFFHEYFLDSGKKTLREYTEPINLNRFNTLHWRTTNENLFFLTDAIDKLPHKPILTKQQIRNLRLADPIEVRAGKLIQYKK